MNTTVDPKKYLDEEKTRIEKYYTQNKKKLSRFEHKHYFTEWYLNELRLNQLKCHYCQTSILEIRNLLNRGIISGRSVRGGSKRGHNFELDRKDPNGDYSIDNCVQSCYYCNNDKSNTFSYEIYINHIGPARKTMWENLKKNA